MSTWKPPWELWQSVNQDELTLKRGGMLRGILEGYFECSVIFLPKAGTVLDRGRTLTHRKIVAQLALKGLSTREFSRWIYHTPERGIQL